MKLIAFLIVLSTFIFIIGCDEVSASPTSYDIASVFVKMIFNPYPGPGRCGLFSTQPGCSWKFIYRQQTDSSNRCDQEEIDRFITAYSVGSDDTHSKSCYDFEKYNFFSH
jgi:hypothetical protein